MNLSPVVKKDDGASSNDALNMMELGGARYLPDTFKPTEKEVILGRGKHVTGHPGNLRFKEFVLSHTKEYSAASTKAMKSSILSQIVTKIRKESVHQAGFVKQDQESGRWVVCEDSAARIAVAQVFRDALHDNYKSSKQFKQQRRMDRQRRAKAEKALAKTQGQAQQELLQQQSLGMFPSPFATSMQLAQNPYQAVVGAPVDSAQDLLMGRLNNVLGELSGEGVPASQRFSNETSKEDQSKDVLSILCDHFGSTMPSSPLSNPFEPRPILEQAVVNPTGDGFQLREPKPDDSQA